MRERLVRNLAVCTVAFVTVTLTLADRVIADDTAAAKNKDGVENKDTIENENTEQWIRGEGANLEIRIQGAVTLSSGQPAKRPKVVATLSSPAEEELPVEVDGNRFKLWIPAGRLDWYNIKLSAVSADGLERFGESITPIDLRQIAIDGLDCELQRANRTVEFKIAHEGASVANAHVSVSVSDGPRLRGKSAADGVFRIDMLPREKLRSVTAWTEDHRFGGFSFSSKPVRDPKSNTHTVDLASCRDQTFRVVDGNDKPVSDLTMNLQVSTPEYNYLGTIDASQMKTNAKGEASFKWFPDWKKVHCYVELEGDDWVKDGKQLFVDGDFVVKVKPRKSRHKMMGVVKRAAGSKAGFHIQVRSFQGEEEGRSDFTHAVSNPDGSFTASVMADATYCVCVNDTQYVSDMIDLIPWPSDHAAKPTATLKVQPGVTVTARLTAGPNNNPIANQTLHLRQEHHFSYFEDGDDRSGSGSRGNWVTTNDDGIAVFKAEPGKKQTVSIYRPDWRTSESIEVIEGDENKIEIHKEFDDPRVVLGIVLPLDGQPIDPDNLQVTVGAIDGNYSFTQAADVRPDGVFSVETTASQVGVLVTTKDGKYSGVLIERRRQRLLRVSLTPTTDLKGRLLDKAGKPIANREIECTTRVDSGVKRDPFKSVPSFFEANIKTTNTDDDGYYVFKGLPRNTDIAMQAESETKVQGHWLGLVKLMPGEEPKLKTDTIDE